MEAAYARPSEILSAVEPLVREPREAAAFFDLDGTLAPIVERPEDTFVPDRTRELVARIADRYASAGVVSGRRAAEAKRILGLDRLTYIGNHGYEVLVPGAAEPEPAATLSGLELRAAEFLAEIDPRRLDEVGLRVEDKAAIKALHWRGVEDEAAAATRAGEIGAEAKAAGLAIHEGRSVLELRPPVELDKGTGLRSVLRLSPARRAFYAGDDRTDADAFAELGRMVEEGRLAGAVRVAVLSEEAPSEVAAAADLSVDGIESFVTVLEALA